MYEKVYNVKLKKKLINLVKQNKKTEILNVLYNELENTKLSEKNTIKFCSRGYPISYELVDLKQKNEKDTLKTLILEDILKLEVDFESYTISYYCPNCEKLLFENKY